ncbi:MAG: hypothetical protein U0T82_17550 [Bacteroidales bacterium]
MPFYKRKMAQVLSCRAEERGEASERWKISIQCPCADARPNDLVGQASGALRCKPSHCSLCMTKPMAKN